MCNMGIFSVWGGGATVGCLRMEQVRFVFPVAVGNSAQTRCGDKKQTRNANTGSCLHGLTCGAKINSIICGRKFSSGNKDGNQMNIFVPGARTPAMVCKNMHRDVDMSIIMIVTNPTWSC